MSLLLKSTLLDAQFGEKGEEVIFCGIITKEGSVHKTWKKRFMELVKNKATGNIHIRYFKDPKSKKQKGEVIIRFPSCSQFCLFKQEADKSYFKIVIREPVKLKRCSSDEPLASTPLKATSFRYRESILRRENSANMIESSSYTDSSSSTNSEEPQMEYEEVSTPEKSVTSAPCSASSSPTFQMDKIFDDAMAQQKCNTLRQFYFCVEKAKMELWKEALLSAGMDLLSN